MDNSMNKKRENYLPGDHDFEPLPEEATLALLAMGNVIEQFKEVNAALLKNPVPVLIDSSLPAIYIHSIDELHTIERALCEFHEFESLVIRLKQKKK